MTILQEWRRARGTQTTVITLHLLAVVRTLCFGAQCVGVQFVSAQGFNAQGFNALVGSEPVVTAQLSGGQSRATERTGPPITALASAPDGNLLLVGSQSGLQLLSSDDLRTVTEVRFSAPHVHDIAFDPTQKLVAIVGGIPAESGQLEVRSWPEFDLQQSDSVGDDLLYCAAWLGERLVVAGADHVIYSRVWGDAPKSFVLRKNLDHSGPILSLATVPRDNIILSGGVDQTIRVWGNEEIVRRLDQHTATVTALAVCPRVDGMTMVASAGLDRTIRFWQPTIGRMVRFVRLAARPLSLAWHPNGEELAVGCDTGRVYVLRADTLRTVWQRDTVSAPSTTADLSTHQATTSWLRPEVLLRVSSGLRVPGGRVESLTGRDSNLRSECSQLAKRIQCGRFGGNRANMRLGLIDGTGASNYTERRTHSVFSYLIPVRRVDRSTKGMQWPTPRRGLRIAPS